MPLTLYVKYTGFYVLSKESGYYIQIGLLPLLVLSPTTHCLHFFVVTQKIEIRFIFQFEQVLPFMSGKGDPLRVLNGKKAQASYQPAFIVPVGD